MLQREIINLEAVSQLSDQELLAEVKVAAGREREATARLIGLLAQVDSRRLYLGEGCSSLFTYCTHVLHLSEHAAYGRIEAARAARKLPVVLDLLSDGSVTLTAVTLLTPHLTVDNHRDVLHEARHKSKREVEHIVARLRPQPAVPAVVRRLPGPTASHVPVLPSVAPGSDDTDAVIASPPLAHPATVMRRVRPSAAELVVRNLRPPPAQLRRRGSACAAGCRDCRQGIGVALASAR